MIENESKKKRKMCFDETLKQSRVNVTINGNAMEALIRKKKFTSMRLDHSAILYENQFNKDWLVTLILATV